MSLLKIIMNFLRIPNRLGRIDYLITTIFMFFSFVFGRVIILAIYGWVNAYDNIFTVLFFLYSGIFVIASAICAIARLHDCGASGWWVILLAPFTIFSVLLLMVLPGTNGANKFGEQPSS